MTTSETTDAPHAAAHADHAGAAARGRQQRAPSPAQVDLYPPRRGRWRLVALAVLVLLGATVGVTWAITRRGGSSTASGSTAGAGSSLAAVRGAPTWSRPAPTAAR